MHEFIGRWFGWVRALFSASQPGRHDGVEAPPTVPASPQPVRRPSVRTATVLDGEANGLVRPYVSALAYAAERGTIGRAGEAAAALVSRAVQGPGDGRSVDLSGTRRGFVGEAGR
jgi:hypothetical protein